MLRRRPGDGVSVPRAVGAGSQPRLLDLHPSGTPMPALADPLHQPHGRLSPSPGHAVPLPETQS